ncbi:MAG: APC family permease [Mycoplasmatales bacterium]|nr:APC family permease [Mycoplasmatales bacterium]
MSIKEGKKLGFFAALTMLVGSVVGIGIFFKNGSIFRTTDNNGMTTLLAWIVGGLISLFAAVSFSEIGSMKTGKVSGLAAWNEKAAGKKWGYFVRFNYSFFYFALLTPILGVFVSELLFQFLLVSKAISSMPHVWVHILVGITLMIIALGVNFTSIYVSGWIQAVTSVLKVIPLILAALIGMIMANTHNLKDGKNAFEVGSFSFTSLLASLPLVLFAYDAFLNVGSMSKRIKGGVKTTSKVVFLGMLSITVLYTLIAISSILHNSGFIGSVFSDSLPSNVQEPLTIFTFLFLFISGYGVLNGMSAATVISFNEVVSVNTLFGSKTLKNKFGDKKATILILSLSILFWTLVFAIPSLVLDTDTIVDAFSNFPTLFFFGIYGTTILLYNRKRDEMTNRKINNILYLSMSWMAIGSIFFVVLYQFAYGMTIQLFLDAHGNSHAGLFAPSGIGALQNWQLGTILLAVIPIFAGAPILNLVLAKKFEQNEVIVNTFE